MNAQTGKPLKAVQRTRFGPSANVIETFWGYIVQKGAGAARRAAAGEIAATVSSILFGISAYCQWLLPGTIASIDVLPFKIVGTIVFFVFAFLHYSIARKGLAYEIQIDKKRQQMRIARRNREGISTTVETYSFSDIRSVYMKRAQSQIAPSRIHIEIEGRNWPILVCIGTQRDLEPLVRRLIDDLAPQPARQANRAAHARVPVTQQVQEAYAQ